MSEITFLMNLQKGLFWPHIQEAVNKFELEESPIFISIKEKVGSEDFSPAHLAAGMAFLCVLGMWMSLGANIFVFMAGFLYPAWKSVLAVESAEVDDDIQWLTYWVVFSLFTVIEFGLDLILHYVPFYYVLKLAIVIFLANPEFKGAAIIYSTVIRPIVQVINKKAETPVVVEAVVVVPVPITGEEETN